MEKNDAGAIWAAEHWAVGSGGRDQQQRDLWLLRPFGSREEETVGEQTRTKIGPPWPGTRSE